MIDDDAVLQRLAYCACNVVITRRPDRVAAYLDFLEREIDLIVSIARTNGGWRVEEILRIAGSDSEHGFWLDEVSTVNTVRRAVPSLTMSDSTPPRLSASVNVRSFEKNRSAASRPPSMVNETLSSSPSPATKL